MEPKQTIYILGSPSHLLPQDLRLGALLPRHECTACRKHCKQVTEMLQFGTPSPPSHLRMLRLLTPINWPSSACVSPVRLRNSSSRSPTAYVLSL